MHALYSLMWWCAQPLLPLRLWWRGRKEPGYREAIGERYGRYAGARPAGDIVWIHAVSAGETLPAASSSTVIFFSRIWSSVSAPSVLRNAYCRAR